MCDKGILNKLFVYKHTFTGMFVLADGAHKTHRSSANDPSYLYDARNILISNQLVDHTEIQVDGRYGQYTAIEYTLNAAGHIHMTELMCMTKVH